jgi:hypothetical protein
LFFENEYFEPLEGCFCGKSAVGREFRKNDRFIGPRAAILMAPEQNAESNFQTQLKILAEYKRRSIDGQYRTV